MNINNNPYGNEVTITDGILVAPGLLVDLREVVAIDSYGFIFSGQTVTCEDELALHLASQWILGSASLDSPTTVGTSLRESLTGGSSFNAPIH